MDKYIPIGEVVALYIKENKSKANRTILEGFFQKDKGLRGDVHSKGGNRQISIFTLEGREEILSSNLKGLCTQRFYENIRVKNLNLEKLTIGSKLKIGETLQEVTEIGKGCFPECNIIKDGITCPLSKQVLFTKVLREGKIKVGDPVEKDMLSGYLHQILNSIPLGIIISDLEGNIKVANDFLLVMFGYRLTELEDRQVGELFEGWSTVKNIIISNKKFGDEEVFVKAKRNRLRFNLRAYPIFDSKGTITEIIYMFNEFKKDRKLANKLMGRQAIYTFDKIIGENKDFKQLIEFSKKIANSKSTVLITGESGTGKEVFAQSIHNYSNRKNQPFVAINSGAIPKSLIESELFGYVGGAFTGAKKEGQPGKFEIADGGTVFLDEIGEMPYDMQTRLLRVIEEGTVSRIGAMDQKVVDVRIIAASNRDLKEEVEKGNFRKDLFYRLNVLPIEIPPLRKRKEDIPLLIDYFMDKISKRLNRKAVFISKNKMKELMDYEWPGNVRELENFLELIINMEAIPSISREQSLDFILREESIEYEKLSLDYMERDHIVKVLKIFSGNITKSAEVLGIGRNTLYRKIEKYKIDCTKLEQ